MSLLSESDLSLPPHMGEVERLRSVITVKDACIANFSTTLRSIEKKASVERETLESHITELETQLRDMRAYALENSGRQHAPGSPWSAENSPSGSRVMDGASTPGEIQARMGSQSPVMGMSNEVNELREKFHDIEKEKNKMEGRVLRAEASSADLLKELRSTYFQLDKTRAQLQEVMNSSDSRSPPAGNPRAGEVSQVAAMSFEKEQQYQREISELQIALRRAKNEITNQARYGRDVLEEEHDETVDDRMESVGRELDLLSRLMGITNTDQLPVASKIKVLKTQVETWRDQREKEGKLLEESKQGMMELLNEFKLKDQQLKEAQAVIAGKGKIFLSKPKENKLASAPPDSSSSNFDPGTVGFTIAGQAPYDILEITRLLDRNGTPQGTPGCLNRTVMRGDRLVQVGGVDVTSAPLSALKAALGGPVDSCVTLRLFRAASTETFEIVARRHVLMSPRSRAASASRSQLVSPRSLAGSLPVSPRNLSSNPISPRSVDGSSGMPLSPARSVNSLPVAGSQLSSLPPNVGQGSLPPHMGQHVPTSTPGLASLPVHLAHHSPGNISPVTLPNNMSLASHSPGQGPAHAPMMSGMPGQWSPAGAGTRPAHPLPLASLSPSQPSSYLPLSPAAPSPSYAAAHARGQPLQPPQGGLGQGGGGAQQAGQGAWQQRGGAQAGAGTQPSVDPWTFDDNQDGNIWTTNPGTLNPSLVLT